MAAVREAGMLAALTESRRQIHHWHQLVVALFSRCADGFRDGHIAKKPHFDRFAASRALDEVQRHRLRADRPTKLDIIVIDEQQRLNAALEIIRRRSLSRQLPADWAEAIDESALYVGRP
jgi:hypothetical protein